jgi:hypothetical protein
MKSELDIPAEDVVEFDCCTRKWCNQQVELFLGQLILKKLLTMNVTAQIDILPSFLIKA